MNVLSLFDGMSCGQIALNRINIKPTNYYASEIDKHAIKVTQANYPNTIQLGDVTQWRGWDVDWSSIDLLIGGSPCQGFSSIGKRLDFEDSRSKLFFEYVEILNHIKSVNPSVKFMLENVKMKKENLDIISRYLGVEPVFINSETCSPCQRPRFYWANWEFEQPEKVDVYFTDKILDDAIEMSDGWRKWFEKNKEFQLKKGYCRIHDSKKKGATLTTRMYSCWNGNFLPLRNGRYAKPGKSSIANLIGAPVHYFEIASQRQAEVMAGNGWTVDVVAHIFSRLP